MGHVKIVCKKLPKIHPVKSLTIITMKQTNLFFHKLAVRLLSRRTVSFRLSLVSYDLS